VDELEIQGKKYISSKRAAKLTGYAKDYIGQLARAGKIAGTRVGRAWYVDESALLNHAGPLGDMAPTESVESAPEATQTSVVPRTAVQPAPIRESIPSPVSVSRVRAESGRIFLNKRRAVTPAMLRTIGISKRELPSSWMEPTYFTDTGELLPRTKHTEYDKAVHYEMEPDAARITIKKIKAEAPQIKIEHPVEAAISPMSDIVIRARAASAQISDKREKNENKRDLSMVLSSGAVLAAMAILLFFSAGLFVSSNTTFNGHSAAYTASLLVGYQYMTDFLSHYPPLQLGLGALGGFFSLIFASFFIFFEKGVSFLVGIAKFVTGN
jgi:excisionase family DNA binding protein